MILFRQKVAIPDFLEAQRKSFRLFLETGIRRELEFITSMDGDPVSDKSNPLQDEYVSGVFLANKFYFKRPVCTPQEAIVQMETYQSTLGCTLIPCFQNIRFKLVLLTFHYVIYL